MRPRWLLRRADQAAVGGLVLRWLSWRWPAGGSCKGAGGRLIELDRMPQRTAEFKVDVNAAEWPELSQLPGIGEELARRIVQSREQDGPFADQQELRRVRGIGPRTLERIHPFCGRCPRRRTSPAS